MSFAVKGSDHLLSHPAAIDTSGWGNVFIGKKPPLNIPENVQADQIKIVNHLKSLCNFHRISFKILPKMIHDSDLYRALPAVVVITVDKDHLPLILLKVKTQVHLLFKKDPPLIQKPIEKIFRFKIEYHKEENNRYKLCFLSLDSPEAAIFGDTFDVNGFMIKVQQLFERKLKWDAASANYEYHAMIGDSWYNARP